MPANLPPEYYSAEIKYKKAVTLQDKLSALEELISTIPKHKGTDKLRADFRRRLSKLRDDSAKKKKSGKGDLYNIEKHGASQACLVGFANSGKSSLLASVTNAHPVIADFPMSTVMPLSGMMQFQDIQFQIIDLPPIGNESTDGWVSGIIRNTHMIIMTIDSYDDPETQVELTMEQLKSWKIPLKKKDDFIDDGEIIKPKPVIIVLNKSDVKSSEDGINLIKKAYSDLFPVVVFSSVLQIGSDELKDAVFSESGIIRVYSKEPGKPPDMKSPFTVPWGSNVMDLARIIHKDFVSGLKYACIWGSAKFDGQRVQKDYILHDRDVVEYHIK